MIIFLEHAKKVGPAKGTGPVLLLKLQILLILPLPLFLLQLRLRLRLRTATATTAAATTMVRDAVCPGVATGSTSP